MYTRILVGTDGSATAGVALSRAIELATMCSAPLHIVSAYKAPSARAIDAERANLPEDFAWQVSAFDQVDGILASAATKAKQAGLETKTHPVTADPEEAILATASSVGADLIVVGSRGMERRVMGSVPNTIAHRADIDVLVVHTT